MPADFPFDSLFDRDRFREDVSRAWRSSKNDDDTENYLRSRGLRYVIQTPQGMSLDEISRIVRERLHPEFGVERLFEDFDGSPAPEELRSYYLATLRGVLPQDLTQNPYEAAYALLAQSPLINVEPDLVHTGYMPSTLPGGAPIAALPALMPSLQDRAWSLRNIRADRAWGLFSSTGRHDGQGVSVAHLDTGWTDHVDLDQSNFDHSRAKDYVVPGSSARDVLGYLGNPGHGTKTASVIMSRGGVTPKWPPGTSPPGEITGVARYSTYVPVRCIKSVILIFNGDVARAVRYATAQNCHVISMSLGGRPMRALHAAVSDAVINNLLVVCASGNNVGLVVWPARYPEAMAIAASNVSDGHWSGSSRGSRIDISAPGEDVWKADPDPHRVAVSKGSGTSYATANMAGVAALWISFHGWAWLLTIARAKGVPLQELFRSNLAATARVPPAWVIGEYGEGIVDAEKLLQAHPATSASIPSYRQDKRQLAALVRDDDPDQGADVLAMLFHFRPDKLDDAMDVFDHELTNILVDDLETLDTLRRIANQSAKPGDVQKVITAIKNRASPTLRRAANW